MPKLSRSYRPRPATGPRLGVRRLLVLVALLMAAGVAIALAILARPNDDFPVAAAVSWPDYVLQGQPLLQEGYRFALARPDVLKYLPCYCGCVTHGDTSNLDCFIDSATPGSPVVFDPHAAG